MAARLNRAVDYFLVVEYDKHNRQDDPKIATQYPDIDRPDFPVDLQWANFALPYVKIDGCKSSIGASLHTFVLTNTSGSYSYGTCISFHDDPRGKNRYIKSLCIISHHDFLTGIFKEFLLELETLNTFRVLPVPIERIIQCFVLDTPVPEPGQTLRLLFGESTEEWVSCFRPLWYHHPRSDCLPTLLDANIEVLFRLLSTDNILLLVSVMLLEGKILLHSTNEGQVVPAAEALCALLFPFTWAGVYVPLLPGGSAYLSMLAEGIPVPFLFGIHTSAWEIVKEKNVDVIESVYIVDLDNGVVQEPADVSKQTAARLPSSYFVQTKQNIEHVVPLNVSGKMNKKKKYSSSFSHMSSHELSWRKISGQTSDSEKIPPSKKRGALLWKRVSNKKSLKKILSPVHRQKRKGRRMSIQDATTATARGQRKILGNNYGGHKRRSFEEALKQVMGMWISKVDCSGKVTSREPSSSLGDGAGHVEIVSPVLEWVDLVRCAVLEMFLKIFLHHPQIKAANGAGTAAFIKWSPSPHQPFLEALVETNGWHVFLGNNDHSFQNILQVYKETGFGKSSVPLLGPRTSDHPTSEEFCSSKWWTPFLRGKGGSGRHSGQTITVSGSIPSSVGLSGSSYVYSSNTFPTFDSKLCVYRPKASLFSKLRKRRGGRRPSMHAVAQTVRLMMKTRPVFATSRKADEAAPDPSDVNVGAKGGTLTMDELLQRKGYSTGRYDSFIRNADLKSAVKMMMVSSGYNANSPCRSGRYNKDISSPSEFIEGDNQPDPVRRLVDELYRVRNEQKS